MINMIIDGHNFMHRARAGFLEGENTIVYNFFRSLRSLLEKFKPERVYFVLEGRPQHRYDLLESYKGNRKFEEGTKAHNDLVEFHRQKDIIVDFLFKYFPLVMIQHPHFECDDSIYNLIKLDEDYGHIKLDKENNEYVVISNDSDFIQLLDEFENVKIYNPIRKIFVSKPEYDYVTWKSLRGDGSDNIPGIKGLGDKTAEKLCLNPKLLEAHLVKSEEYSKIFERNYKLIKFNKWTNDEYSHLKISLKKDNDWSELKEQFRLLSFKSLLEEKLWSKFVSTFDYLFEGEGEVE